MAGDLKLHSFDAKTRKATYKGNTPITPQRGLDFKVQVTLPDHRMSNQKVSLSLDLDSYEADTFDEARHRMALWLRNVAEALEGEVEGALPVRVNRVSKEAVLSPEEDTSPSEGDAVFYQEEDWTIERHAAREQVKIRNNHNSVFVPIAELVRVDDHWVVNSEWHA